MDRYFDVIYYSLPGVILVALGFATLAGLKLRGERPAAALGTAGSGVARAAIGTTIALIGGLLADALLKDTSFFQQVRFGSYHLGFALLTSGMNAIRRSFQGNPLSNLLVAFVPFALGSLSLGWEAGRLLSAA